jgi:hypothetical protein
MIESSAKPAMIKRLIFKARWRDSVRTRSRSRTHRRALIRAVRRTERDQPQEGQALLQLCR